MAKSGAMQIITDVEWEFDIDNFGRIFKERTATLVGQKVTAKTARDLHRIAKECLEASYHIGFTSTTKEIKS